MFFLVLSVFKPQCPKFESESVLLYVAQLWPQVSKEQNHRGIAMVDAADIFGSNGSAAAQPPIDVKSLHAKIGELTLENDFLEGALNKAGLLSAKR